MKLVGRILTWSAIAGVGLVLAPGMGDLHAAQEEEVPICEPNNPGPLCWSGPDPSDCVVVNGSLFCRVINIYWHYQPV